MKLAQLKKFPLGAPSATAAGASIRGTEAQDSPLSTRVPRWRRHRLTLALGGSAILVLLLLGFALKGWLATGQVIAGAVAACDGDARALRARCGRRRHAKRLERDRQALTVAALTDRVAALTVRSPVDGMVANLAQPQRTRVAADASLLTVAESGSAPEAITVGVRAAAPGFRVEVGDRGSGLSAGTLRDALLPFYSTKPAGTGLGLTPCREIIEAHGGRLSLANREGGCALVTAWLP